MKLQSPACVRTMDVKKASSQLFESIRKIYESENSYKYMYRKIDFRLMYFPKIGRFVKTCDFRLKKA